MPAVTSPRKDSGDVAGKTAGGGPFVRTVRTETGADVLPERGQTGERHHWLPALRSLRFFLYRRIKAAGEDRRFREIKTSFIRFLMTWTIQGLWVTFSSAAAWVVITSLKRVPIDAFAVVGLLIWILGFTIEVVADSQKSAFKADPANVGKFINTGLWSWSRHPNYFGEIVLWLGVAIISLPVLQEWQWIAMISPIFITLLLTRISGIPMLEKRAEEKWGGQEDYEDYKRNTSVLIPLPPSKTDKGV